MTFNYLTTDLQAPASKFYNGLKAFKITSYLQLSTTNIRKCATIEKQVAATGLESTTT